jgi:hypothetical protein
VPRPEIENTSSIGLHQFGHRLDSGFVAVQCTQRRHTHDRQIIAREAVAREQLANLEFHEVEQLGIVNGVDLVERHDQVGHVDLTGEQHVLASLGHRAVDRTHDENGAVHLRRASDHVLDVVGVARAIDVRVVAILGAVFHVARRDGQDLRVVTPALRLGGLRHLVV